MPLAVDTNVLVRYLVVDDARQSAQAAALIERVVAAGDTLYVSDVVVCELVWVLSAAYKFKRAEIARTLKDVFRARHLTFNAADQLMIALAAYVGGKGDFSDYLIREHARAAGADTIATFDRALLDDRGFVAPAGAG